MTGLPEFGDRLGRALDRVAAHRPRLADAGRIGFRAATALVLAISPSPHLIVIRRATRAGDPWSGHAALPGGRHDQDDGDLVTTARRETLEEVGVCLPEAPVGRLDDLGGRTHNGVVSTFVFTLESQVPMRPEPGEVAGAHWVPLDVLTDPRHRIRHPHRRVGPFPAWSWPTGMPPPLDDLVIWGLTHRTLSNFLEVARLG